jgi:2-dehydropantoate 2-reductase
MIKNVAIIGLGAVGSIYAWRLSEYLGYENVEIIVDENRRQRYIKEAIFLNGKKIDFNYNKSGTKADLLIIATKNNHLESALSTIAPYVGDNTILLSLLNGIDSEEILEKYFGKEKVLYSFTTALDSTRVANRIDFSTEGIIYFGEKNNKLTKRVKDIKELFDKAKINYNVPENIHLEMWAKFMVNVSINTISAITRATYGECASNETIKSLIIETQKEVIALAQKLNIKALDDSYIDKYQKIFAALEYGGKTSMLQDVEANRETENRWFCIKATQLGKQLGVATPLIEMLGQIMAAIDAVNTKQ